MQFISHKVPMGHLLKLREFDIIFRTKKVAVIDKFQVNDGFLFKETICSDSYFGTPERN